MASSAQADGCPVLQSMKRMWLLGDTKGITEEGVIGGVGGSETVLLLLLRYEGGGPRLSRRIGELPFSVGRIGGGRAVLVRADVVTKRSARGCSP